MLKIAAAVAAFMVMATAPALAQSLSLGQYRGSTEYVSVTDAAGFTGLCEAVGIKPGVLTASVATVGGLGAAWTQVLATVGDNTDGLNPYGVVPASCAFSASLPAAGSFTANGDGSYSAAPTDIETTTCTKPSNSVFTLTSSNQTVGGVAQTLGVKLLALPTGNLDSGFALSTTNTAVAVGGDTWCHVNLSAQYLLTGANALAP